MYQDGQGHTHWAGVTEYSDGVEVLKFVKSFPGADFSELHPWAKAKAKYLRAYIAKKIIMTINGEPVEQSSKDDERHTAEAEAWDQVATLTERFS